MHQIQAMGFYSIATFDASNDSSFNNAIEAVIPETQTIVAGATVKLALSNDVTIQMILRCHPALLFMGLHHYQMNA